MQRYDKGEYRLERSHLAMSRARAAPRAHRGKITGTATDGNLTPGFGPRGVLTGFSPSAFPLAAHFMLAQTPFLSPSPFSPAGGAL